MKMKRMISGILIGAVLVIGAPCAFAQDRDKEELSAYQWGYWDKMVSPAAGPVAPVGDVASTALPPVPQPTPTPIPEPEPPPPPPPPVPERPEPMMPEMPGMPSMPEMPSMPQYD